MRDTAVPEVNVGMFCFRKQHMSNGAIAGLVFGCVFALLLIFAVFHRHKLKMQQQRFRQRFVQQVARNIEIGSRPGDIAPGKLAEEILHIGHGKETISKGDLERWLSDIKMDFISKADFDALWDAMDIDGSGDVDPVEFIVFLSACGRQFEKVCTAQKNLPRSERLKLAARRLTKIFLKREKKVSVESKTNWTGTHANSDQWHRVLLVSLPVQILVQVCLLYRSKKKIRL